QGRERRRSILGPKDTDGSKKFSRPHDRTEVPRVPDLIERDQDAPSRARGLGCGQELIERPARRRFGVNHDPTSEAFADHVIERFARNPLHAKAQPAQRPIELRKLATLLHPNFFDRPGPRAEELDDRSLTRHQVATRRDARPPTQLPPRVTPRLAARLARRLARRLDRRLDRRWAARMA